MLSISSIIIILIISSITITWYKQLQAKEFAYQTCFNECKQQGYLLLDQTVALQHFKITRKNSTTWYLYRQYSFDYTETNLERYQGYIELHGLSVITVAFKNDIVSKAIVKPKANDSSRKVIPFPQVQKDQKKK